MAVSTIDNTFRTQFNDEFVMDFDRAPPRLKMCVNSRGVVGAETIKFDVVDPSQGVVQKGRDGKIPQVQLGLSQVSALNEKIYSGKFMESNFDLFRGNPNMKSAMRERGITAIGKGVDQKIIDTLDSSSVELSGTAGTLSTLGEVSKWLAVLWNKDIPDDDGNVFAVVTKNASLQLNRIDEFKSADYIDVKISEQAPLARVKRWQGVNWISHNGLTGRGTASAKCYLLHKSAIGHMLSGDPESHMFTDDDDNFGMWFAAVHAAAVCLPRGIVRYLHDDTAAFA